MEHLPLKLDDPTVYINQFSSNKKKVNNTKQLVSQQGALAGIKEYDLTDDVDVDGIPNLCNWYECSYKSNYDAASGVPCIISNVKINT